MTKSQIHTVFDPVTEEYIPFYDIFIKIPYAINLENNPNDNSIYYLNNSRIKHGDFSSSVNLQFIISKNGKDKSSSTLCS